MPNKPITNIAGRKFNRVTVLSQAPSRVQRSGARQTMWNCKCDCGTEFVTRGADLKNGKSNSCGCYQREQTSKAKRTHGLRHTPEYTSWAGMHRRCNNPNDAKFKDYGARGIKVCEQWASFETFLADMGKKPGPEYSIGRKDNDANYAPSNCRWETPAQQSRNTTRSVHITIDGVTMVQKDWARVIGWSDSRIRQISKQRGISRTETVKLLWKRAK